jgi:hypothetical protein
VRGYTTVMVTVGSLQFVNSVYHNQKQSQQLEANSRELSTPLLSAISANTVKITHETMQHVRSKVDLTSPAKISRIHLLGTHQNHIASLKPRADLLEPNFASRPT